jgi:hypothetical protein
MLSLVLALAALGGCGGGTAAPQGIDDPVATATPQPVPDWYTAPFRPAAGSVVVEAIETPDPGFGRTVTWRVPGSFDDTLTNVNRTLDSLGWKASNRQDSSEGATRRTSFIVENDQVYAVRVFSDQALQGVRLTVELPASG